LTNTASDSGPIIDSNPVFDSVFVMDAAKVMSLVVSRHSSDSSKEYPGDSFRVEFLIQF